MEGAGLISLMDIFINQKIKRLFNSLIYTSFLFFTLGLGLILLEVSNGQIYILILILLQTAFFKATL